MPKIIEIEKCTKERQLWNARTIGDDIMYCHGVGQEAHERMLLGQVELATQLSRKQWKKTVAVSAYQGQF